MALPANAVPATVGAGIYLPARRVLRRTLVRAWPGPIRPRRRVAVAGIPRSGTSWLAKALSLAPGVSYYYEPDRELARLGDDYVYRYREREDNDKVTRSVVDRSLRGMVVGNYQIVEQGLKDLLLRPFARTVLVKWVWLSPCLDWISARFPDLVVVQIIRHPVPQFLSWRRNDWDPACHLDFILRQPGLMHGPLQAYASVMHQAETYWEKVGAFWGAMAHIQLAMHRPGWILREHEWYCLEAGPRIRWLVERLGLTWRDQIGEFLVHDRKIETGQGYGARRDPRSEVHKWEKQISASELAELDSMVRHFDLPFYRGMDPEAFWSEATVR